jgi:hypothetical protein
MEEILDLPASLSDEKSLDPAHHLSAPTTKPCDSSDSSGTTHPAESNASATNNPPQIRHTFLIQDVAFVT